MARQPRQVRHQLFLPQPTSDRLRQAAIQRGVSRSVMLTTAVTAMLDRQGRLELDDQFSQRLEGLAGQLDQLIRDSHIELETLAIFIRYVLMVLAPLADHDVAGQTAGAKRFEVFLAQVARRVRAGNRTLEVGKL